jgi:site-specific DNA-methyltransferase (adenine-specific)
MALGPGKYDCWLYGSGFPKSRNLDGDWKGWGTALKPAYEPIFLARKPFRGTVAANVLRHGTGGINVDACRIVTGESTKRASNAGTNGAGWGMGTASNVNGSDTGRWPANVLHDGSDEVLAVFPDVHGAGRAQDKQEKWADQNRSEGWGNIGLGPNGARFGDSGSAARFFYTAKADRADRADSRHPTVKPIDLMRWLVRLIVPPGGIVLDPFAGSGTTGEAAMLEGCDAILIEADAQHVADIRHRVKRWSGLDAPLFTGADR